jgi:hypothetical protein
MYQALHNMLVLPIKIVKSLLLPKCLALQMLIFDAGGLQIRQNWELMFVGLSYYSSRCFVFHSGCRGTTALQFL